MGTQSLIPSNSITTTRMRLAVAWGLMLLTSSLPAIILNELGRGVPSWLLPVQLAAIGILLMATFFAPEVGPLRPLALVMVTILAGSRAVDALAVTTRVQSLLPANAGPFVQTFLAEQAGRMLLALLMIAVLWLVFRDRRDFSLTAGKPATMAAPIRWLGITRPVAWNRLGPIAAVLITLGTLAFFWFGTRAGLNQVATTLSLMPLGLIAAVLLVAFLNSFAETVTYRLSFLSTLEHPVGAAQALLMAAVWFGIGHYYGVPYGILGVVMATFLGWFLGRSVLETRGIVWAWAIHFIQDVTIFFFLAMGMVNVGG